MSSNQLNYKVIGDFAVGGVANLRKITLGNGTVAILRELQSSKFLNFTLRSRFNAGCICRHALSPHPNLVNSFEYGSHWMVPYEIIEFVNGVSLRSVMTNNTNSPALKENLALIIRQMAQALAWVHENGLMHLDVKPENFLIERSKAVWSVKLTDFDLVRMAGDHGPRKQMGTPAFMAPEQFRDRLSFQASDVFAFGLIAYQLLTGKRPFYGDTEQQMWRNQASQTVAARPIREINPDVSPMLEKVIMTCLSKNLSDRYRSMDAVLLSLNRTLGKSQDG